jgi:serine/threonine protein kinase
VEEYLAAWRAGRRPGRRAFLERHAAIASELADCLDGLALIHSAAPRLQRQALGPPGDADRTDPEPAPANPLGDFRLTRELGRGGMGVVYEAEQLSLGRRVALKVLPFAAALDAKQLQRFRNEALAAAHLDHPHIVPVYAVGCERGVHYYAMRLIEGQSLAALIGQLRHPPGPGPAGPAEAGAETAPPHAAGLTTERSHRSREFVRAAARLAAQAAEALEHAHQTGVVHRDVKPGNLLLDGRGHLWVTDFGLAQVRGDVGLTRTGDLVGTLRYMAPEQARARHDLVDHRADVYALGATLYELLTLRPACDGHDREEVLGQLLDEEPPPPRRLNPAVPADLETVLLKAMAREPEARYATAQDLADDLGRFLDDRPVQARRPSLARRAARWARRHRPLVASAAFALVLTVVMLASSLRAVSIHRAEAVRQRDFARKAVDTMYTDVAERWLEHEPEMEEVQREFLQRALEYYEEFARAPGADPQARLAAAEAYRRVGDIQVRLEAFAAAEAAYGAAIDRLGPLAVPGPVGAEARAALATCHHGLGGLRIRMKRYPEAEEEYRRAIDRREQLVGEGREPAERRGELGMSYGELGRVLQLTWRQGEAEKAYLRAVELLREVPASPGRAAVHEFQTGVVLGHLAELLVEKGDPGEARKLLDRAVRHHRTALNLRPRHAAGREALALQLARLGATHLRLGDVTRAKEAYLLAVADQDRLATDFPKTPMYRAELARQLGELGDLLHAGEGPNAAGDSYRRALELREQLARDYPESPGHHRDLAWFLATCPDPKRRDAARALAHARRAVELAPQGGDCWRALGAALCRAGEWSAAADALERAAALRTGGTSMLLALARAHLGRPDEARALYAKAVGWLKAVGPETATHRSLRLEVEAALAGASGVPHPAGPE